MSPRIIKLTLAYDGTDFAGWQVQPRLRTVQGMIEDAVGEILKTPARVYGAGRTDAGVHASGQVAHFETASTMPPDAFERALNSLFPRDLQVLSTEDATPAFHARYSATGRTYRYAITFADSVFERRYAWFVKPPLDLTAMVKVARVFVGEHDFATFGNASEDYNTTVRRVIDLTVNAAAGGVTVEIKANAFLYRMVRNVVATLARAGKGEVDEGAAAALLAARDRAGLGPAAGNAVWAPAPPHGLTLTGVDY